MLRLLLLICSLLAERAVDRDAVILHRLPHHRGVDYHRCVACGVCVVCVVCVFVCVYLGRVDGRSTQMSLVSKETYSNTDVFSVKRDLLQCQQRPTVVVRACVCVRMYVHYSLYICVYVHMLSCQ
jgi:hypothetical protein